MPNVILDRPSLMQSGASAFASTVYAAYPQWVIDPVKGSDSNPAPGTFDAPIKTFAHMQELIGTTPVASNVIYLLNDSPITDPFTPGAGNVIRANTCVFVNGQSGLTTLWTSTAGAASVQQAQPSFVITGATDASPIVCSFNNVTAPYVPMSGDRVVITGGTGDLAVNGVFWITVLSPTTFALFSDQARTVPVAGTGAYNPGTATATWPNVPWSLIDPSLPGTWSNSGPGGTSLIGAMLYWPSTGAVAFPIKDLGGKGVRFNQPTIPPTQLPTPASPDPFVATRTTVAAGVPYLVVKIPKIGSLITASNVDTNQDAIGGERVKYAFVDTSSSVGVIGGNYAYGVRWWACKSAISGATFFGGCLFPPNTNWTGGYVGPEEGGFPGYGNGTVADSCASFANWWCFAGVYVSNTIVQGNGAPNSLALSVLAGGNAYLDNVGVFDSGASGLSILPNGAAQVTNIWGAGSAKYGVLVTGPYGWLGPVGGKHITNTTAEGMLNDIIIGGDPMTYAAVGSAGYESANKASVYQIL